MVRPKRLVAVLVTASLLVCAYQTAAAEPTVLRRVEEAEIQGKKAKVTLYTMPAAEMSRIYNVEASRTVARVNAPSSGVDWSGGILSGVAQSALGMLSGAISNFGLFCRGLKDVGGMLLYGALKGTENLNSPEKLRQFWEEAGIYEKYNKRERQFLNRVVFPAALTITTAVGIGSSLLFAKAAAAGVAAVLGASVAAPVALFVPLMWAGFTAYKALRTKLSKGDVVGIHDRPVGLFQSAWEKVALSTYGFTAGSAVEAGFVAAEELRRVTTLTAAEKAIGVSSAALGEGIVTYLSGSIGAFGMAASSQATATLINAWGIPETEEVTYGELEEIRSPRLDKKTVEFNLRWRLSK